MLHLSFVDFNKGSYVLVDGADSNDRFFIIKSGRVMVSNSLDPGKNSTKILTTGDFVGVIPCMSRHAQIENAIALEDSKMICVTRDEYPSLIEKNVPVALKIMRTFSARMREMNEQLTSLTVKGVSTSSPEQIYIVADYYYKNGCYDAATYAYYQYLKECPNGKNKTLATQRYNTLLPTSHAVYYESDATLVRDYPKETMIMAEGQSGHDMFVIQEGIVKITKIVEGNEVILSILKKGDMFGEMALLENKPRSASAVVLEQCRLFVINRKNFDQMVMTQPQLISRLTTTLSERLWSMYRQLSNTRLKSSVGKAIDMLSIQLEKGRNLFGSYQTSIDYNDLMNMCGIPKGEQEKTLNELKNENKIKTINGKIYIPDCQEIIKLAAFFKKQESEMSKNAD